MSLLTDHAAAIAALNTLVASAQAEAASPSSVPNGVSADERSELGGRAYVESDGSNRANGMVTNLSPRGDFFRSHPLGVGAPPPGEACLERWGDGLSRSSPTPGSAAGGSRGAYSAAACLLAYEGRLRLPGCL